jgi:hypothetical protein
MSSGTPTAIRSNTQETLSSTQFNPGWLQSTRFDLLFILGTAGMALLAGAAIAIFPHWFVPILLLNIWAFGYHHITATFTRLTFDRESFHKHKFLILVLPGIVMLSIVFIIQTIGLWAIATIYFYWQWFHYTRQSYGISKAYMGKTILNQDERFLTLLVLYLIPTWGILSRSNQQQTHFLDMDITFLPIPDVLVQGIGLVALLVMAAWYFLQFKAYQRGNFSLGFFLYMTTHLVIFTVGYLVIEDMTEGWLVVNIWHNTQYLLFVWLFNQKRFQRDHAHSQTFLGSLSQNTPRSAVTYFLICMLITVAAFLSANAIAQSALLATIPFASLVIFQTINFHHYIVDAIIWRRPKPAPAKLQPQVP